MTNPRIKPLECDTCGEDKATNKYDGENLCDECLSVALAYDDESWFFANSSGMVGDD